MTFDELAAMGHRKTSGRMALICIGVLLIAWPAAVFAEPSSEAPKKLTALVEVQKEMVAIAEKVTKEAERRIEQRSDWIKKNKETELHFMSTLKSPEEYYVTGAEPKMDEKREKLAPMKKLMNWVVAQESGNKTKILNIQDPISSVHDLRECELDARRGYSNEEYTAIQKKAYPEIADWLEEKLQFCQAVVMHNEASKAEYGLSADRYDDRPMHEKVVDLVNAWEVGYETVISTYPEFSGFYVWYYAATKYVAEGKAPDILRKRLERDGLLEAGEARYQSMNERFGTLSEAREKVQARVQTGTKDAEWRAQVMAQAIGLGPLTFKIAEAKPDFMSQRASQRHFLWVPPSIEVGRFPKQIAVYPDANFFLLALEVTNKGQQNVVLESKQFHLTDAAGHKYAIHEKAQSALRSVGKSLIKTTFPDSTTQGFLIFDVPQSTKGLVLNVQARDGDSKSIFLHWRKPK